MRGLLVVCAACSASAGNATFGTTPVALEDVGGVHVDVFVAPDPPARGNDELKLVVTDSASGAPVEGLTFEVTPWMAAMGHGASIIPTVTSQGLGTYVVHDIVLTMPGDWQLRTTMTGATTSSFVVTLTIP